MQARNGQSKEVTQGGGGALANNFQLDGWHHRTGVDLTDKGPEGGYGRYQEVGGVFLRQRQVGGCQGHRYPARIQSREKGTEGELPYL